MNKPIIQSIREYFTECPILDSDSPIYVDYIGKDPISYSINKLPGDPKARTYVDGGGIKQFDFAITATSEHSPDVLINLENIGVMENLERWITAQNRERNLPVLAGNMQSIRLIVVGGGFMLLHDENNAIYQIQMKLLYLE